LPTIGVLAGAGGRDDVSRQLAPLGVVAWYERAEALVERARAGAVDAVVTGFDDASGRSVAPTIVALAACCAALPIIVHGRVDGATLHKLLAAFVPGLRMHCAVQPFQRLAPALRHVLSPAFRPSVTPVLLQRFVPRAPAALRVFVALAALVASTRRGVEEIAGWNGVSSRTIERRLHRERWPAAHVVLQSFVALDAVWLMTEYGWSARHVREVRGFPHESSVTRLLTRYAGVRPATLREEGGFEAALAHVERVLLVREVDQREERTDQTEW
jgi:hypothetical protein